MPEITDEKIIIPEPVPEGKEQAEPTDGGFAKVKKMKKLLVVVDMQNDFIDGSLGTKEARTIVPAVKAKIEQYRKEEQEVVFTLDTHYDNYPETLEGKKLPVKHCIKGTAGWELSPELAEYEGERFEKPTFGCISLARYLDREGYDEIELVGLCTDICVISNAILARTVAPGTPVSVDAACCAGVTPESHQNALEAMKICQIEIR